MHAPGVSADAQGSSLLEAAAKELMPSLLKFNPRSPSALKSRFTCGMSGIVPFCEWAEAPETELWDEWYERRFRLALASW